MGEHGAEALTVLAWLRSSQAVALLHLRYVGKCMINIASVSPVPQTQLDEAGILFNLR